MLRSCAFISSRRVSATYVFSLFYHPHAPPSSYLISRSLSTPVQDPENRDPAAHQKKQGPQKWQQRQQQQLKQYGAQHNQRQGQQWQRPKQQQWPQHGQNQWNHRDDNYVNEYHAQLQPQETRRRTDREEFLKQLQQERKTDVDSPTDKRNVRPVSQLASIFAERESSSSSSSFVSNDTGPHQLSQPIDATKTADIPLPSNNNIIQHQEQNQVNIQPHRQPPPTSLRPSWRTTSVSIKKIELPEGKNSVNELYNGLFAPTRKPQQPSPPASVAAVAPTLPKGDLFETLKNLNVSLKKDIRDERSGSSNDAAAATADRPKEHSLRIPPHSSSPIPFLISKASDDHTDPEDYAKKDLESKTFMADYVANLSEKRKQMESLGNTSFDTKPRAPLLQRIPVIDIDPNRGLFQRENSNPARQRLKALLFEQQIRLQYEQGNAKKGKDSAGIRTIRLAGGRSYNLVEAADALRIRTSRIRQVARQMGEAMPNSIRDEDITVEPETLQLVALECGLNVELVETTVKGVEGDQKQLMQRRAATNEAEEAYSILPPRPPVVCIMGHVDHGKTTLMDTLRRMARGDGTGQKQKKSKKESKNKAKKAKTASSSLDREDVAGTEAGGITQVITAFQVPLPGHEVGAVTFLDTPGHAAFRSMRQSGSDAADIIVLVVAADDGVSETHLEILKFYKSIVQGSGGGGISLVIAMNKIDKPGINVEEARSRIENELLEQGIYVEGMKGPSDGSVGAPVQLFPISALTGEGVEDLVEGLALQSEIMDLRADENAKAEGYIMDARVEKGLGIVADAVIRWGSISKGDYIMSGANGAKVRILKDVLGNQIKKGTPSQPVRFTGFETLPTSGSPFVCVSKEEFEEQAKIREAITEAEKMEETKNVNNANAELQSASKVLMRNDWREKFEKKMGLDDERKDGPIRIPIILRADAEGSLSAIRETLTALQEESKFDVVIDPIIASVGPLLESEVEIAKESNATIVCFNVKLSTNVKRMVDDAKLNVMSSDIIYRILEEARDVFGLYLPKRRDEKVHGRAKLNAVFDINGLPDKVAGLTVTDGSLYKSHVSSESGNKVKCFYRVLRKDEVISKGDLVSSSLKHFKEDVEEIPRGKDCGLSIGGHNDYQPGDIIECYSFEMNHQPLY